MGNAQKMVRMFRFECVAATFSGGGIFCSKGFKVDLPEGHRNIQLFSNKSFKKTSLPMAVAPFPVPQAEPEKKSSGFTGDGPSWDDLKNPNAVRALQDSGFGSIIDAAKADDATLLQINGVGPATVKALRQMDLSDQDGDA